jgi:ferredoxin
MPALVDPKICIGCKACVEVCPVTAIHMEKQSEKAVALVNPDICIDCTACVAECPVKAISMKDENE